MNGWKRAALKHLTTFVNRGSPPEYAEGDSGIPVINQACIPGDGSIESSMLKWHVPVDDPTELRGWLIDGDILVNSTGTGTLGRVAQFRGPSGYLADAHVTIVRASPDALDPRFLTYMLRTSSFYEYANAALAVGATNQIELNRDALRSFQLTVPDVAAQRAIADFLDAETARIDALVDGYRRILHLLWERFVSARRSAISSGGTSGRIPWMPIDSATQVQRLARLVRCLDGRRVPLNAEERAGRRGDVPYWGANGVVDRIDQSLFDEEVVLLGEDGAPFFEPLRDVAFVVNEPVWVNNHIHVLRPIRIRSSYLCHYLNSVDYSWFITGSTRDKLTQEGMSAIPVPVPEAEEQARVERVVAKCAAEVETLARPIDRQIALLEARKQALITAAVTGQLDVANGAA